MQNGAHVIVVGRRQERLDAFVKEHGPNKASAMTFDVHKSHPDLDLVFLNSGIQNDFNWGDPKSVDLSKLDYEVTTNYLSYIHLTTAFLPYLELQSKTAPASIVFTTSGLALLPITTCPNYCATKAALHHWIMCLRVQLKKSSSKVKVIEILPPAVRTELHDRYEGGREMGIPMDEFLNDTWGGLIAGHEQVAAGFVKARIAPGSWEAQRQEEFANGPGKV